MRRWTWGAALVGAVACGDGAARPSAAPVATEAAKGPSAADRVEITDIRVRAQPPGIPNSAGFFRVNNPGADAAIVGVSSTIAAATELHTHTAGPDGMMQMRQVPRIDLPSGQVVSFEPGGLHVMFIGLSGEIKAGTSVAFTLRFDDGSERTVSAPAVAFAAGGAEVGHGAHP